ncbi:MAG: archease [Thaumarchaeota archaeon]|nr:archease [Candidatus Calditenuaceae archaeon]MDW8187474.1 archease [Nitrososphaerota archaeon]
MSNKGFEFLEHTSDVYVRAYGRNVSEAFEEAGRALFSVLVRNLETVREVRELEVRAVGYDKQSLLYDWLEKLLLVFQLEKLVASRVVVLEVSSSGEDLVIRGKVFGEDFDPTTHIPGIDVKSPTYWLMEIKESESEVEVRFVLDI